MDGCQFLAGAERDGYCAGYDEYVLSYVDSIDPDTVLTTVTLTDAGSAEETLPDGAASSVQALLDRGIDVIAARDTPRWESDQFQCAEDVIDGGGTPAEADEACGADASQKLAASNPAKPLADLVPAGPGDGAAAEVTLLDLSTQICPEGRCSPVLGDVSVYMDDDHLTRLFVEETLAPRVTELLANSR